MDLKTPGTNNFMLRLALLIASFAVVDGANAACAPASPVNNVTVTCTGATTDANGTTGYGTNTGNTYNILSGATVTGIGLRFNNLGTISNSGMLLEMQCIPEIGSASALTRNYCRGRGDLVRSNCPSLRLQDFAGLSREAVWSVARGRR